MSPFIWTKFGALWPLEWAWHHADINLCCARILRILMLNLKILAFIVSEITAFIQTDRQMEKARLTRIVILIKYIYTIWGRKRCHLFVTYNIPLYCTG